MAKEYVKQAVSSDGTRTISAQRGFSWQRFLFQWEWMLVLMLILVNVFNISASPYYAQMCIRDRNGSYRRSDKSCNR